MIQPNIHKLCEQGYLSGSIRLMKQNLKAVLQESRQKYHGTSLNYIKLSMSYVVKQKMMTTWYI